MYRHEIRLGINFCNPIEPELSSLRGKEGGHPVDRLLRSIKFTEAATTATWRAAGGLETDREKLETRIQSIINSLVITAPRLRV